MTGMEMVGGGATIIMLLIAIPCVLFYGSLPIIAAASSVPWAERGFFIRVASASLPPMLLHALATGGTLYLSQSNPILFDGNPLVFGMAAVLVAGIACIWSQRRALRSRT